MAQRENWLGGGATWETKEYQSACTSGQQQIFRAVWLFFWRTVFCFCKQNKKHKRICLRKGMCFYFLCFLYSQKPLFFIIIKKIFSLFFNYSNNIMFFHVFSFFFLNFLNYFLYFYEDEFHPTTTLSPTNPFFFLKLLKLIQLHMVTKSLFI